MKNRILERNVDGAKNIIDELVSEIEELEDFVSSLQDINDDLINRINELEEQLKDK